MLDLKKQKNHFFDVVGALYDVHTELGPGLKEFCFQEGLRIQ